MHDIDAVLDTIRSRDAAAARLARGLWAALRVGAAHPDKVTRYDVQHICWTALPRLPEDPAGAAGVLAELLELLGYPRYAEICRSATTAAILAADRDTRPALVEEAWRRSGVEPPDTPALRWGKERGTVEQAVHAAVGRILEEAEENRAFGGHGAVAPRMRMGLTVRVLGSPAEGLPGTWYHQIFQERMAAWLLAGGSQTRREMLVRIGPEVARPPEESACHDLPALGTLLDACRGRGVRLTRNGYLPTALVRELVELMRACADLPADGRGESRWPPVANLRYVVTDLGLIHQVENRLVLTELGQNSLADPDTLTKNLGEVLVATDTSVQGVIQEVILAALLLETTIELDRLLDKAVTVVTDEGWAEPAGELDIAEVVREFSLMFLRTLHMLDVLDVEDDGREVGLTLAGTAVARWALRARVMLREVPG